MGYPASGKTVLARQYQKQGYHRINRDELGGTLSELVLHVERQYSENGTVLFVMDNTYPTVESFLNICLKIYILSSGGNQIERIIKLFLINLIR